MVYWNIWLFVLAVFTVKSSAREFICDMEVGWMGISFEKRIYDADVVVHVLVINHFPLEDELAQDFPFSYKAEVRVLCILKGGVLPSSINVTNIGTEDCSFTRIPLFHEYILLLQRNAKGELEPFEPNMHPAALRISSPNVVNILTVCGTEISLPHDVSFIDSSCSQWNGTAVTPCVGGASSVHLSLLMYSVLILLTKICIVQ